MSDPTELSLATVYTLTNSARLYAGKFYQIEIQDGTVNIYATLRENATAKTDMTKVKSNVSGFFRLMGTTKFYVETVSGTPKLYCNFRGLLV